MNKIGTEKQGNLIAVVDYTKKENIFSKVLTKKAKDEFNKTGNLPFGVTVKEVHPVIETFNTKQEADHFIKKGLKSIEDKSYGIFKSKAQYQLAKKTI